MDGRIDDKGKPLDGSKEYVIRFENGKFPPAKAFWSISMYNIDDGSFVENPINRYSLGDRTRGIVTNSDGPLDIYIQHESPSETKEKANRLPSPKGGFYLNLRMYVPDDSLPKGMWQPPAIRAVM